MKLKFTAIIPTFNEAAHIEAAIKSVDFADEILIIDSFSTDETVAIAKRFNVKIIQRRFDDFSSQKNEAISQASNDWIFVLDADERINNVLKNEIEHVLKSSPTQVGFYVYRSFFFLNEKVKYGGWQTDKVMRLFNRKYCKYNGNLVHELVSYKGEFGYLKEKLDHYSYRSFEHYKGKIDFYAELQAKALIDNGGWVSWLHVMFKPAFRFFVHYVIRLGFLDGKKGFILASIHAHGVRNRYLKYWMLKKNAS